MTHRRYEIITNRGKLDSTDSLRHALRLVANSKGYRTIDDTKPEPKYRWLKDDIAETKL